MNILHLDERLSKIEKLLLGTKKVFNFEELVEYTGLSRSYLYKLTASGTIPFSKPSGKVLFFDKDRIDQWLLENANETNAEIELKASKYILNKKR